MAREKHTKRWRLKDGAPKHYVHGRGILQAGDEFDGGDKPMTDWCEEVVPKKTAGKGARQEEGAASAAPDSNPRKDPRVDPPGEPPAAGTF